VVKGAPQENNGKGLCYLRD